MVSAPSWYNDFYEMSDKPNKQVMTTDELLKSIHQMEKKFINDKYSLRLEWAKSNARFEIGDIIGSVVGMLKVESIGFQTTGENSIDVVYRGRRYTKTKGLYFPTKHNHHHQLTDYGSVKLLMKGEHKS